MSMQNDISHNRTDDDEVYSDDGYVRRFRQAPQIRQFPHVLQGSHVPQVPQAPRAPQVAQV